jgi:hypothetical protein
MNVEGAAMKIINATISPGGPTNGISKEAVVSRRPFCSEIKDKNDYSCKFEGPCGSKSKTTVEGKPLCEARFGNVEKKSQGEFFEVNGSMFEVKENKTDNSAKATDTGMKPIERKSSPQMEILDPQDGC